MRRLALLAVVTIVFAACAQGEVTDRAQTERAQTDRTQNDRPADSTVQPSTQSSGAPIPADSAPSPSQPSTDGVPNPVSPTSVFHVPEAVAINVVAHAADDPMIAWSTADAVFVAEWANEETDLRPTPVHGSASPFAHPIERPAISIGGDGVVHFAFTALNGSGGSVWYGRLDGDEILGPMVVSGDPEPETNLVHSTLDASGSPVLAWLEDSTLSVAPSENGWPAEFENVDELTCDCCNPAPVALPDGLVVLYRDLERTDDMVLRNVVATVRDDAGFSTAIAVADEDWDINACPFSGPAAVNADGDIVVTWMDARQSLHPNQDSTTIWVDRSSDGGRSFGRDVPVSGPGVHRWPVLAYDDGAIHLVWQAEGPDGGILYRGSHDAGRTFGPTLVLGANGDPGGTKRSPSVALDGESLLVTWVDQAGGNASRFSLADLVETG